MTAVTDVLGAFKSFTVGQQALQVDPGLLDHLLHFNSPQELATFFIDARAAGLEDQLGSASGGVVATILGGFIQSFQRGSVCWHAQTGAHAAWGAIHTRWRKLGGEGGWLGFPTSEVTPGRDAAGAGWFAHFTGGSIYWLPPAPAAQAQAPVLMPALDVGTAVAADMQRVGSTTAAPFDVQHLVVGAVQASDAGAFEVHGAIREKYLMLGAEASLLGYPATDESGTPDGVGRFNHFQGGSIYWSPATSAHEVHGLIRGLWASLGWERNADLGYPVSDEMIPDRHAPRRPDTIAKPFTGLPIGVIKVPADAAGSLPAAALNLPAGGAATLPAGGQVRFGTFAGAALSGAGRFGLRNDGAGINAALVGAALGPVGDRLRAPPVVSLAPPPPERSRNRFGDFENGVLFWKAGELAATVLQPVTKAGGAATAFSGADVATRLWPTLGSPMLEGGNIALGPTGFVGTTATSFDGAQTRNRRHRLRLALNGMQAQAGPLGMTGPVSATAELLVEVAFDPVTRAVTLTPIEWAPPLSQSAPFAARVTDAFRAVLDPLLWRPFPLVTIPEENDDHPVAVLAVKTLPDGRVGVFVEPPDFIVLTMPPGNGGIAGGLDLGRFAGMVTGKP